MAGMKIKHAIVYEGVQDRMPQEGELVWVVPWHGPSPYLTVIGRAHWYRTVLLPRGHRRWSAEIRFRDSYPFSAFFREGTRELFIDCDDGPRYSGVIERDQFEWDDLTSTWIARLR
jgi:hypothetical protein